VIKGLGPDRIRSSRQDIIPDLVPNRITSTNTTTFIKNPLLLLRLITARSPDLIRNPRQSIILGLATGLITNPVLRPIMTPKPECILNLSLIRVKNKLKTGWQS